MRRSYAAKSATRNETRPRRRRAQDASSRGRDPGAPQAGCCRRRSGGRRGPWRCAPAWRRPPRTRGAPLAARRPPAAAARREPGSQDVPATLGHHRGPACKHTLIDDLSAAAQRVAGRGRRLSILRLRDLDHVQPVRTESRQDVRLVRFAPFDEHLEADVERLVRLQATVGREVVEADQMATCQEVRQVAGRESRVPVDIFMADRPYSGSSVELESVRPS